MHVFFANFAFQWQSHSPLPVLRWGNSSRNDVALPPWWRYSQSSVIAVVLIVNTEGYTTLLFSLLKIFLTSRFVRSSVSSGFLTIDGRRYATYLAPLMQGKNIHDQAGVSNPKPNWRCLRKLVRFFYLSLYWQCSGCIFFLLTSQSHYGPFWCVWWLDPDASAEIAPHLFW